jgi:hypothetical protein
MTGGHLAGILLGPSGVWRFIRVIVVGFTIAAVIRLLPYRAPSPSRPKRRRARLLVPVSVTAAVLLAGGGAARMTYDHYKIATARATIGHTGPPSIATPAPPPQVGVFEAGATASYQPVDEFTKATGVQPGIVLYYSGWNDPFQIRFASWAHQDGAEPFAQMLPNGVTMTSVATGRYDGYLRSFAAAVRAYGHPVILGFAPEMDGGWYTWGAGHTRPADWVAAWRHVVTTFRQAGATNVTWLWTVSNLSGSTMSLRQWWPGAAYVDEVGIDGYYYTSADTFTSVFGATISQVHQFTAAPILISETATGPGPKQISQIGGLFAGVRADHLAGLVWFDMAQHDGLYHQDWRIEDTPAAVAAFREAAAP